MPTINGQVGPAGRPQMSQAPMARHPSREQLIDYLMLKVSQPPPGAPRGPQDAAQQEVSARTAGRPQQKENEHARLTQARVCVCVSDPRKGGEESRVGFQYIRRSGRPREPLPTGRQRKDAVFCFPLCGSFVLVEGGKSFFGHP